MNKLICGAYAVLLTPFAGGKPDLSAYADQIARLNRTGIKGYTVNGSTGEFVCMSLNEQMSLTDTAAERAAAGKGLVVSACTACAADTLRLARHAHSAGAKAVLVCPPYYFTHTQEQIRDYFLTVAERSPVPVLLYNIPFFTQEIAVDTVLSLIGHENIAGIKDSSANMKRLMHFVYAAKGKNFSVLTGTDDILFPALAAGCDGSMTAFASVFPDDVCAIYDFMDLKQEEKARAVQERLLPLLRKADALPFPKGYKLAMQEASGIAFGDKEDE